MFPLYHITKKDNIKYILTEGIVPGKGKGMSRYIKHNVTFLTDSIKYIVDTQIGYDTFIKDYSILKIDSNEIYFRSYNNNTFGFPLYHPHEFVTSDIIPTEKITIINDQERIYLKC